jgi:thiol-disulfide isomerase/thioredoxin
MANKKSNKRVPGSTPGKRVPPAAPAKAPAKAATKRPPAARRGQQQQFPVFWVGLGVVLVIAVIAAIVAGVGGDDSKSGRGGGGGGASSHEFGTIHVKGSKLPPLPDRGKDPAIGSTIPTVTGENFSGQGVTIAPNGKAQMIVFLAHWCPHCNREAPKLAAYLQQHGGVPPANVALTIVPTGSNDTAPNWPPSQWVKTMGLGSVPTLVDSQDQQAAAAFGLTAYPFIVSVDAQGQVVDRRSGEQAEGFFQRAFDALAAGSKFPAS